MADSRATTVRSDRPAYRPGLRGPARRWTAARPLDDLAVPGRRAAGAFSLRARTAHPTGVEARARSSGELEGGEALLFSSGMGAATAVVLDARSARATHRARRRTRTTAPACSSASSSAGGSGTSLFDQTGPPPAGADLVWVEAPVEPAPDDARLRGRGGAPRAGRLRRDRRDAGSPPPARAGLRPRPALARRSTSPATTTCCSARWSCEAAEHADRLRELRTRTGIVAAPDAAWLLAARA